MPETIPAMFEALDHVVAWLSQNDRDWLQRLAQRYGRMRRLNKHEREILEAIYSTYTKVIEFKQEAS